MTGKMKKSLPPTDRDRADAARLQRAGRHGDTILAHINPEEAGLLDWLADRKIDATRNPKTGLLSFGMSDGESGRSGGDANAGGVGGGPAGGNTGGGIGGNTDDGTGGRSGGYGDSYGDSYGGRAAKALGDYYQDSYINGMVDNPYAPKDTWERVLQELMNPSVPGPGRFGAPTVHGPGIVGTAVANMVGGPMSGLMGLGAAMGRAQSPAQQAASMAHNQSLGAQNSTGNENARLGHTVDALGSPVAGSGSGGSGGLLGNGTAQSAAAGTIAQAGGLTPPTVQPGQVMDTSGRGSNTLTGLPPVVQNLLMDYIWRGRQGTGFNW